MSEVNKSYRIKTEIGNTSNDGFISIDANLIQDYDSLDILSIKLNSVDMYRLHNSNYGVVVGRVLANNGFGIPNAKLSIFINVDNNEGDLVRELYPFTSSHSKDTNGVQYNLLPDEKVADCHQVVGTFPNKRYMLDNDVVLEVYDKYYKYTTRTNNAGDYLIMGVPVGSHTLHMDLDLSDCGILSQKPRDFVYKGYTIEQFENPSMFKEGTNYGELSQIFTQDQVINVQPFWGNESLGEPIGLTRADINVAFKFETTCVFMGCVASDNASNGITKKCMATENMGNMEEMTTGEGTIEMIRKTPSGDIESFQVRGTQLIDGNGVWCYQIPMNLDYMMTDEYGNMVPTDDPEKGIPTRASVRFRISMQDNEENLDNFYRAKVLVPHNPQILNDGFHEEYDYEFGTYTRDDSFRDLFWDNVYSVKSYIPRFQKKKVRGWKDKKFTGIKSCNFYGNNNPMPYNNMRIRLPLMFIIMCAIIKGLILITTIFNEVINALGEFLYRLGIRRILGARIFPNALDKAKELSLNVLSEGLCPDLENWFFAPLKTKELKRGSGYDMLRQTMRTVDNDFQDDYDKESIDYQNQEADETVTCLTTSTNYLIQCVEMNLAMEYRVINFDFYNDWINGLIYIPRFMRYIRPKKTFLGITFAKAKTRGCMDNTRIFAKTRRYTQQCSMGYKISNNGMYTSVNNPLASNATKSKIKKSNNFHKKSGFNQITIFGKKGGICHEHTTSRKQNVYYMKPCEWKGNGKVNLFATDIILLGSLKSCDENGLPQAFKYLSSTSYIMPTNLALTNMETNGPLYVNNNGTICAGNSNQKLTDETAGNDKGVGVLSPNNGITAELEAYSQTGDKNIDTQYEGNELSDIIPLTEAAGISWDYTGPGQGEINKSLMYYPGGHFLGLSCVNAQSNIKSCVNLSRICEVGTVISQRKEDIAFIDNNGKTSYVYTAPTGVISGDEINGEDFRTMFATMNQNRLQATKFNPETGYYYYDFSFLKPIYFEGAFGNVVKKGNTVYNTTFDIPTEDNRLLNKYGIAQKNDFEEINSSNVHTQTKTKEYESEDYYSFRFGLPNSELNKTSFLHKIKYLKTDGSYKYLPQYENSYYFYFGMKAGASAIDEFNKQFFSVCDTSVISHGNPTFNIEINSESGLDLCNQTAVLDIIIDNVELPLQSITYTRTHDGIIDNTVDITNYDNGELRSKYVFNPVYSSTSVTTNFNFGSYAFDIIDSNGIHLRQNIEIGTDLFNVKANVFDFNINDAEKLHKSGSSRDNTTKNIFNSGYIQLNEVTVNDLYKDFILSGLGYSLKEVKKKVSGDTITYEDYEVVLGENIIEKQEIYVDKANIEYKLYIRYKCNETPNKWKEIYVDTFTVKDGQNVSLCMGWPNIAYNDITPSGASYFITYGINESGDTVLNSESASTPYLNYGQYSGNTNWWDNNSEVVSGDTVSNWIKRVSIYKTNPDETFSNNIFTTSGRKVLWGDPQNEDGLKGGIYCTENDTSDYSGFSLDDDASYYSTKKNYSAVAIDNNIIGGDYFAILSGGTIISGKTVGSSGRTSYCGGKTPTKGTGYVLKTLPEGETYFYTYTGQTLEKPEGYFGNGIYYPSFEYPVIEKNFDVQARFYIWSEYGIDTTNVGNGSFPDLKYEEMAGRTELKVSDGIRFNKRLDKFGNTNNIFKERNNNIVSFVDNSVFENFIGVNLNISGVSGMNVVLLSEDEDGEEVRERIQAYEGDYTVGVAGVTEVYYDIREGYPIDDERYVDLVNNKSWSVNYESYFAPNIGYEIKPGRGLDVFVTGEGGTGSGEGIICCCLSGNTFIKKPTDGNAQYVYIKQGSSEPTYYVLCNYKIDNADEKNNGFTFLRIRYFNKRRFYIEYYDENNVFQKRGPVKKGRKYRNKLHNLLYGGGGLKYHDSGWTNTMTPIKSVRMNCNESSWEKHILEDNIKYEENKFIGDDRYSNCVVIQSGGTHIINPKYYVYYVDKIQENNNILYKIYPSFNKLNRKDDGITLNLYRFKSEFNKTSSTTITLKCELDKVDSSATTITSNDIKLLNESLFFEQNNGNGGNLKICDNNYNDEGITEVEFEDLGIKIESDFYSLTHSSTTITVGCDKDGDEVEDYYIDCEVNFNLIINSGNTSGATDRKIDQIFFYLTNQKNGERLDIIRESNDSNTTYFSNFLDGRDSIQEKIFYISSEESSSDYVYFLYKKNKINPDSLGSDISYIDNISVDIEKYNYQLIKKKDEQLNEYTYYYSVPCKITAKKNVQSYEKNITIKATGFKGGSLLVHGINGTTLLLFVDEKGVNPISIIEIGMIPSIDNEYYVKILNNTDNRNNIIEWGNNKLGLHLENDVVDSNIYNYKLVQNDFGENPYSKYLDGTYVSANTLTVKNDNGASSTIDVIIKPQFKAKLHNIIEGIEECQINVTFDPNGKYKKYYENTFKEYTVILENNESCDFVPPMPFNERSFSLKIEIMGADSNGEYSWGMFEYSMLGYIPKLFGGISSRVFQIDDTLPLNLFEGDIYIHRLGLDDYYRYYERGKDLLELNGIFIDGFFGLTDINILQYDEYGASNYIYQAQYSQDGNLTVINEMSPNEDWKDECYISIEPAIDLEANGDLRNTYIELKIVDGSYPIYYEKIEYRESPYGHYPSKKFKLSNLFNMNGFGISIKKIFK